ncbi:hypothetical protein ACF05W_10130 [Streptomyces lydicus]|uniref:hypothetical protein n=1 Tax=Streptomyces lydicus TaxID=47763 RepID=UPI0036FF8B92
MSPAEFTACNSISLASPDSPAPWACVTRRNRRATPENGRRNARPAARPARRARPSAHPPPAAPGTPRDDVRDDTLDDFRAVFATFATLGDPPAAATRP